PVTLLSFSGYKDGSRNQLSWTTGTEINNRGFDVQRSADGINYTSIGFVNSLATGGNSNDQLSYRFTDNTPAGVKQYYRLRQEDLDGRSKLSNIVLINGARPTAIAIRSLFPNPASVTASMIVDAPSAAKLTVLVSDMAGRNMVQQIVNVSEGSNMVALNIASLQSGTYLVRVMSETGEVVTGKLVKQ
ncbi:MAG TPA: T9SS type A sorting domain-containing protein, partial [Chitinophagaceae bacterium]|nr:T9SS type A sorting domain-containing protein [Chitinophagaceae bacterium]